MLDILRASIRELAYKIKGPNPPRFSFFLGAGASRQSGIPVASEMIRQFKEQIIIQSCPDKLKTEKERNDWLAGQDWCKADGSDYCKYFEKFEPKEFGRQRHIEDMIKDREPSFGYVVLANLMARGLVNTIVTTNFDDLIYSACTTFTGIRPVVYAYGILAAEMRFTAQRTKILKLHGDYLYSKLKNTNSELAEQDPNMARQLRQVLNEYGLIVVGYGGGDESVLKVLSEIPAENDLYWCIRRGEEPNDAVKKLLRDKRGFLVEIEGFDEMMNEIRPIVEFDVQKMIGSIEERRDQIINQLQKFDPQYATPILGEIVDAAKEPSAKLNEDKKINALDLALRGWEAHEAKDFHKAEALYRKAIEIDPERASSTYNLGIVLSDLKRYDEAEAAYRKAIEIDPNFAIAHNNLGYVLIGLKRYEEAEVTCRKAIELDPNLALAHNNLGNALNGLKRYEEAETAYRNAMEVDPNYALAYSNLGNALRGLNRYDEAEAACHKAIEIAPNESYGYDSLSDLLRLFDRDVEALSVAEKSQQLDPLSATNLLTLASIHKKLGHQTESTQYITQARELFEPDAWYTLACVESVSGNTDAAIENLSRAAQLPAFDVEWARVDPDLEWIRDDPRFTEIVGENR